MATKNARQTLVILMAMRIQRCDVGCIAQWSASMASCKATRCHYQASAHAVLPRRPPWSTILNEKNTNKTQLLPSFLTVDRRKKAKQYQDPSGTLYSRPWRDYP
jgi:predicted CxxxxCH...CXXCH cytochrome family protein